MATLPTRSAITSSSTTNAEQKVNFGDQRDFLADLLGTDSSDKVAARAALGAAAASALLTNGTAVTASGTSVDFGSIPAGVKRIVVSFASLSTNGSSQPIIQLGDSGGVETSGYLGAAAIGGDASSPTVNNYISGFGMGSTSAANLLHGAIVLTLIDAATNTWAAMGNVSLSNVAVFISTSGSKPLSAVLTTVRLTTLGGVNTFDGGLVNIQYE